MKNPRDRFAPDGVISDGERLVRKGGRVKFAGRWWQSDALIPFVGLPVDCGHMDYWQTECSFTWLIWPEDQPLPSSRHSRIICSVKL